MDRLSGTVIQSSFKIPKVAPAIFLDRQATPSLKLYPTLENATDTIVYDALVRIDDADDYTNTTDVPSDLPVSGRRSGVLHRHEEVTRPHQL